MRPPYWLPLFPFSTFLFISSFYVLSGIGPPFLRNPPAVLMRVCEEISLVWEVSPHLLSGDRARGPMGHSREPHGVFACSELQRPHIPPAVKRLFAFQVIYRIHGVMMKRENRCAGISHVLNIRQICVDEKRHKRDITLSMLAKSLTCVIE